jgi:TRAP-type C4-dicarboxylate transport system permease small subunit
MITPVFAADVTCPAGSERSTAPTLAGCNVKEDDSLMPTVKTIIDVIIGVLGIVAVIVIVLGGVQYTLSTGDPGRIKKAKDTILYGIIGLVVAILAYAIVNFVLSSFFK